VTALNVTVTWRDLGNWIELVFRCDVTLSLINAVNKRVPRREFNKILLANDIEERGNFVMTEYTASKFLTFLGASHEYYSVSQSPVIPNSYDHMQTRELQMKSVISDSARPTVINHRGFGERFEQRFPEHNQT